MTRRTQNSVTFMAWGLLALLAWGPAVVAQEGTLSTPADIPRVNALLRDPTQTRPVVLEFSGTVVYAEPPSTLCVQSGFSAVVLQLPAGKYPWPRMGDRLELEAPVRFGATEADRVLTPTEFRNLGPGPMPEAGHPWLVDALNGGYPGRLLEVEGIVMQTRLEGDRLRIHLADESGWAVATIFNWTNTPAPDRWWGARLRVRSANIGRGHDAIRASAPAEVTLLTPGSATLFEAPLTNAASLRSLPAPLLARLRLRAQVLETTEENVFLRSEGIPLRATYLRPFQSGAAIPHAAELLPGPIPELRPGDWVELVGSPIGARRELLMSFSSFRLLGSNTPPEAASPPPTAILSGAAANDWVRVTGRLAGTNATPAQGARDAQTLTIEVDGRMLPVLWDAARLGAPPTLHPDDMLEATGLVLPGRIDGQQAINLLRAGDLRVLYLAPRLARERTLRVVGITVALLLAAGGWIAFLWFKLAERDRATAAMRELNSALERRVTERTRELEAAKEGLHAALGEERRLHELKTRFVSMISHEFRTPLAIIMSSAEILDAYLDRLSPEDRAENLRDIVAATRHLGSMVEEVLLLSRVEAGKLSYRPTSLDLVALCERMVEEVVSVTHDRCPILLIAGPGLAAAYGDEALLRHIFTNLLHNAVKYSPPGESVEFRIEAQGESARFEVHDRGIGIPQADARDLFTAFHRGSNVGDTPGTGLGMVIVKSCVELHQGTTSFETREGQGTTFRVSLPLLRLEGASPLPLSRPAPPGEGRPTNTPTPTRAR
ncbi:MAG TPA: hypothetical protein DCM86_18520 [Verrucomicrobiales bacterium]|nr:hypothetical protein [Verrucomicrobiales bacterium]